MVYQYGKDAATSTNDPLALLYTLDRFAVRWEWCVDSLLRQVST